MESSRRGGSQPLENFCDELGFPAGFAERGTAEGDLFDAAVNWLAVERPQAQNHWPALSLALVAQAEELLSQENLWSIADVFQRFPPEETFGNGRPVNTLNLQRSEGKSVKLRPLYNSALTVIRHRMLRNHPSNPGHATQSWRAYRQLISFIYAMTPEQRRGFAGYIWNNGVLPLGQMQIAEVRNRVVRPFEYILRHMPTAVSGVRGGALLQGLAYGYLLADSPNLILESHNVNTGSSRAGMLGDVDGFRGSEPELAAEVKDLDLDDSNVEAQLGDFLEDIATAPNATAVVICRSIANESRDSIEQRNVTVLTLQDLAKTVAVWDLPKQQEALRGVDYYLGRIQKSDVALQYFRQWLKQCEGLGPTAIPLRSGSAQDLTHNSAVIGVPRRGSGAEFIAKPG